MDDLVEKVAEAIWRSDCMSPGMQRVAWEEFSQIRFTDANLFRDNASAAIAAVRAYDLQRTQHAIDAYMAGYDPDDYTHPLSLTVGPRHTRGGLTSG